MDTELITRLAKARKYLEEAKADKETLWLAFQDTDDWKEAEENLRYAKETVQLLEAQAKEEALLQYNQDGNKEPHPAVKIKTFTVLDYDDQQAVAWCHMNFKPALKLDTKLFEALKKSNALPDFVDIKEEPRAQIASNLSAYLT